MRILSWCSAMVSTLTSKSCFNSCGWWAWSWCSQCLWCFNSPRMMTWPRRILTTVPTSIRWAIWAGLMSIVPFQTSIRNWHNWTWCAEQDWSALMRLRSTLMRKSLTQGSYQPPPRLTIIALIKALRTKDAQTNWINNYCAMNCRNIVRGRRNVRFKTREGFLTTFIVLLNLRILPFWKESALQKTLRCLYRLVA